MVATEFFGYVNEPRRRKSPTCILRGFSRIHVFIVAASKHRHERVEHVRWGRNAKELLANDRHELRRVGAPRGFASLHLGRVKRPTRERAVAHALPQLLMKR